MSNTAGVLFGTLTYGATQKCGCGVVFKLVPTDSGYKESTLHIFTGNGRDDAIPYWGVIADKAGALYGTTFRGGSLKRWDRIQAHPVGITLRDHSP